MKVLLVDLETEWRGGQSQALLLLKGLQARGHEAELVAASAGELQQRACAAGISVHAVERHFLRARRNWFARLRYDAAARIVAISRWSAEHVIRSGIPESKLAIVYEGIEIPARPSGEQRAQARARWGVPVDAPLLGCVGVLSPDKGQEWLIRSLAELRKKFPTAKLLLAGDGPCRERLQKLAREVGVVDAVISAGFISDIDSVYAALDVFLLPSFFEALSNALMSAMAYAIPSIAFNLGGPAEIIEDGKSGLLVEPANVESLCTAISRILDDAALASSLGENGRHRIEQDFSAAKMVGEMLRIYEECLA